MSAFRTSAKGSFVDAMLNWRATECAPVIAEIKLSSPKHGRLMDRREVAKRLADYEAGAACCISVVTGRWYGGDIDLLHSVRRLTTRPLLRKDFITCRRAIDESLQAGADAVLLTKRLLSASTLRDLAVHALRVGITPFVEVGDQQEIDQVALPDGVVLAFNNRDIRERERGDQGIERSLAVQRRFRSAAAPVALASASGIAGPEEVATLIAAGFDAALVGTALVRSRDASGFLRRSRQLALLAESRRRHVCAVRATSDTTRQPALEGS